MKIGKERWRLAFSVSRIKDKYVALIESGDIQIKEVVPNEVMRKFSPIERDWYLYHVSKRLQTALQTKLDRKRA